MRQDNRIPASFLIVLLLATAVPAAAQEASAYETPPVLKAADLVDAKLLEGPHHRVDPEARNDGFMNHFTIRSDFGDFEAESEVLLATRVQEVFALAKLSEISKTDAFRDALARSVARPVTAIKNVATDPVGTLKGIPGGLSKKFRGLHYRAKKASREVKEEVKKDDEPAGDAEKEDAGAEASEGPGKTEKTTQTVKKYSGWEGSKRQLARSLQIDPYTTNPVVQAELDRLASAAFAGGLTFKFAMPSVSGLGVVEDVNEMVWNTPPAELERLNDAALKELGIDSAARFELIGNRWLTLSLQTRLVQALKKMSATANLAAVVGFAAGVESDAEARFFVGAAEILAGYHTGIGRLSELRVAGNDEIGEILAAVAEDGTVVVAGPVDYLIWQPGMEAGALSGYEKRQLWTTGRLSPRAQKELSARGWGFKTEVSFGS